MKKIILSTVLASIVTMTVGLPMAEACGGRLGQRLKAVGRFILRR